MKIKMGAEETWNQTNSIKIKVYSGGSWSSSSITSIIILLFFFFLNYLFILLCQIFSWGRWDLSWADGVSFPDQGSNLGPPALGVQTES